MSQLKRYNGVSWENVGGNIAPKTTTTSSDTDTYSCNYINGKLEWTLIDEKTGNASVSLPETFNELLCIVSVAGSVNVCFSIVIPYIELSSTSKGYNAGYFGSADSMSSLVRIISSKTSAYLTTAYLNKADSLSSSTTRYYYR